MSRVYKKLSFVPKYLAILLLMSAVSAPVATRGQEAVATNTATSTVTTTDEAPVATTTLSATTSPDTPVLPLLETSAATTTGEILGESTTSNSEENPTEDTAEPAVIADTPPLSVRKFERRITADKKAAHSCEAETFRIDISGKTSAQSRIMFLRDTDTPYEVEVGGLPDGIDVTFRRNGAYQYAQGAGDRYLTLLIRNEAEAQKGNFSIPIVYTQKGAKDSSVICQINIINQ